MISKSSASEAADALLAQARAEAQERRGNKSQPIHPLYRFTELSKLDPSLQQTAVRETMAKADKPRPSTPIILGGSAEIIAPSLARATLGWRSSTAPPRFTPCTAKTLLAKSIPVAIMVTSELMKACTSYVGTASQCAAMRMTRGGEGPSIR